jgi:hypothetical protein
MDLLTNEGAGLENWTRMGSRQPKVELLVMDSRTVAFRKKFAEQKRKPNATI